jgi:hypothetical protein
MFGSAEQSFPSTNLYQAALAAVKPSLRLFANGNQ